MHNTVFKNNWLIYSSNKTCIESQGYRDTCLQAEQTPEAYMQSIDFFFVLNPIVLLISKKGSQGIAGSFVIKFPSLSFLWSYISSHSSSNYWYSTCSSMFHPCLSFALDSYSLFFSPEPLQSWKPLGAIHSLSLFSQPTHNQIHSTRCNLWDSKLSPVYLEKGGFWSRGCDYRRYVITWCLGEQSA